MAIHPRSVTGAAGCRLACINNNKGTVTGRRLVREIVATPHGGGKNGQAPFTPAMRGRVRAVHPHPLQGDAFASAEGFGVTDVPAAADELG